MGQMLRRSWHGVADSHTIEGIRDGFAKRPWHIHVTSTRSIHPVERFFGLSPLPSILAGRKSHSCHNRRCQSWGCTLDAQVAAERT
jgi:hypothetical protein